MTAFEIFPLLFLLILLLIAFGAFWGWYNTRKRREAAQAWAQAHGWHYTERIGGFTQGLRGGPFSRGSKRRSTEVLQGSYAGKPAASWRYSYTVESGGKNRSSTTYHHHVLALGLPEWLPYLELTAESFLSRVFGGADISFEDDEFNRTWRVRGDDQRIAYDVIHPRMMARLMQPDMRGVNLLYEGGRIMVWRRGNPDLDAIDPGLRLLDELLELIPPYVWDQARERRAWGERSSG